MPLTDETFAAARDFNARALNALLADGYASAFRIAHALSGDERTARAIAEVLVRRSLHVLPKWRDASAAEHWFIHHAVLTTRSIDTPAPEPANDPLVRSSDSIDPAYPAFVRALRQLVPQQREAFILHHGERLNPRRLGVAMDCSSEAATSHLRSATDALNAVTANGADAFAAVLTAAYAHLDATPNQPAKAVRVHVRRVRRRLWLRRAMRLVLIALVVGGLGWAGWTFRDELIRRFNERLTT